MGQAGSVAKRSTGRMHRAWPLNERPARDLRAWNAARQIDDLLDPDDFASQWTGKSLRTRLTVDGLWLDHLARTGALAPMAPIAPPGAGVSEAALAAFIAEPQARVSPLTRAGHVARLVATVASLNSGADRTLPARARRRLAARVPASAAPLAPGLDGRTLLMRAHRERPPWVAV